MFLTVCSRTREASSPISQTADKMESTSENASSAGPAGPAGLHPDPPAQSAPGAWVSYPGAAGVEESAGGRPRKRSFEHFAAPTPYDEDWASMEEVRGLIDTLL